jgi:all-trans-retinol 13,14-reductase
LDERLLDAPSLGPTISVFDATGTAYSPRTMGDGERFDDLVIGAGMAGLTTAALLAAQGRKVLVLDAHDTPGGYAHTFSVGRYRFCAQVHYIFGCGEGEPIHDLLSRTGLDEQVRFHRLDPEGFDHVVVAGDRTRIPNGLEKFRDRLMAKFPEATRPIRGYFDVIMAIGRELDRLPSKVRFRDLMTAPFRFGHLLKYKGWTLGRLYDSLRMPARLRTILAGQAGDYLLPPSEVSLLLHVALVRAYDRGAYYPEKHYVHFIASIADFIRSRPGCQLRLSTEVDRIDVERGRVTGVHTKLGETFTAARYISNVDPRVTARLVGERNAPNDWLDKLDYEYSSGNITLYLGIRGLDLKKHGFGSWNVWHYPQDDLDAMYRRQRLSHDFREPWLFMSTPTLHTSEPGLCPPGEQILELATSADYAYFKALRDRDRRAYNVEKKRIRERIVQIVEERYLPGLSKHLVMQVMGTPATNARFCSAPFGNAYGSALTPENVSLGRVPNETPFGNLWLVNASAGFPSIGGTVKSAIELFDRRLSR